MPHPFASQPDRRTVLKGLAAGAAAVGGLQAFPARHAHAAPPALAPEGTTLDSTVVRGSVVNDQGYVRLASGPGEPHVARDDLGAAPRRGRELRRTPLLSFVHLTDIHVIDAQSPARVEFTDRYNDGPGEPLVFSAAYRPHEMLTPQISDSIVAAVEHVGAGPVTRRGFDFAVCTGDNVDNAQLNELRWSIDVLDGTPLTPNSGATDRFEGVHDADPSSYDVHYWHPDGTPEGAVDDNARRLHGFPVVPGLLEAATRPFTPVGLSFPWYSCYGNHDGLVQGNFPQSFQLTLAAEGPLKIVGLPAGISPDDFQRGLTEADPTVLGALATAPTRVVTADPQRKIISRTESVQEHFTTGGTPLGHGFTAENVANGTAYYVFDPAPQVRCIVLDSVNPNGESSGSLDQTQFAWLRSQLEAVSGPGRDKLVLVFSHHTVASMTNRLVFADDPSPRVLGAEVAALLLEFPNVIAWVNGHTHVNRVTPYPRAGGGGFWEINTASHVDWPTQARLVELVDNADGTLSVFGTLIDADAPLSYGGRLDSARALASLARELAANDWQERSDARRGAVEGRNVELLVTAPFALARTTPPAGRPAAQPRPAGGRLPATGGGSVLAAGAATALAARRFPRGTIQVVVVDPGVGTNRAALAVESDGRLLVGPDNGVLSPALITPGARTVALPIPPDASPTFHGRDVFAPAAAALARGRAVDSLGSPFAGPVIRRTPEPKRVESGHIAGEIILIDRFGNAVTNLVGRRDMIVEVGGREIPMLRTYADAAPGTTLALVGSNGLIEIAVRDGNAANELSLNRGDQILTRHAFDTVRARTSNSH